jgi:NAD(P)-dependent dehydrogenase (short-subunit alcohol dehydrogenase family)
MSGCTVTGLLAGKRVIVTGGANGLGRACALEFARHIDDAAGRLVGMVDEYFDAQPNGAEVVVDRPR